MPVTYVKKQGDDLILELTTWDGWKQKHTTTAVRAPKYQHGITLHPRHITAWSLTPDEEGEFERHCIAPSVKGYSDVAKRFTWGAKLT